MSEPTRTPEPRYEVRVGKPGWGIDGTLYLLDAETEFDYWTAESVEQLEAIVTHHEQKAAAMRAALDRYRDSLRGPSDDLDQPQQVVR